MTKIRVGITGQSGFVGSHLFNYLGIQSEIELIPFDKDFFSSESKLQQFADQCEVIVHLAAVNRHENQDELYRINVLLVQQLVTACEAINSRPHIIFSSSTQEMLQNSYGASKLEGNRLLTTWAKKNKSKVTLLTIPNVFGPFGKPFYNSVVATFCHKLTHKEEPSIIEDKEVSLLYVNDLIQAIHEIIKNPVSGEYESIVSHRIPCNKSIRVSEVLKILKYFQLNYLENGVIPSLSDNFHRDLFNTFRCYIPSNHYPVKFKKNTDQRGSFVELARTQSSGQTSFSVTLPGITRGNHFHTRKAERFAVVKGKAKIELRRINTEEVISYELDGENPSYVDMPIWYTHNITNIGSDELFTIFWINEPYNPADPDTYLLTV
ncbi:MAG: NAD-dependent epimerase/dehydratase family protein [Chryseotalea sp. WA131a]|jgi:UDP-2-acetamido-2,6-beta-L-arabino-hexul-4-ose reductase|nr:MAG: NAD-dependent epimerase/dehydratase family protein [Chryseotalea sp. WA131a]